MDKIFALKKILPKIPVLITIVYQDYNPIHDFIFDLKQVTTDFRIYGANGRNSVDRYCLKHPNLEHFHLVLWIDNNSILYDHLKKLISHYNKKSSILASKIAHSTIIAHNDIKALKSYEKGQIINIVKSNLQNVLSYIFEQHEVTHTYIYSNGQFQIKEGNLYTRVSVDSSSKSKDIEIKYCKFELFHYNSNLQNSSIIQNIKIVRRNFRIWFYFLFDIF